MPSSQKPGYTGCYGVSVSIDFNCYVLYMLTNFYSGTPFGDRPVWFCMDQFRTSNGSLDSTNDLLLPHRNSQCEFF